MSCLIPRWTAYLLIVTPPQWALASDSCPAGVFETNLDAIKKSFEAKQRDPLVFSQTTADNPTPEISRIKDGAVGNYVGAFINDGIDTSWGYDAERHLFLRVAAVNEASPVANSLTAHNLRIHPQLARNQNMRLNGTWAVTVTVVKATPEQAQQFACLANVALGWRPIPTVREPDVDPVVDDDSPPPAEITVRAPKRCPSEYQTDTLQASFGLLKEGRGVQPALLDAEQCDCACQRYQGSLMGEVEGFVMQGTESQRRRR